MKTILFIAHCLARCYNKRTVEPWSTAMTATRPSSFIMTAFVLAAAVLVATAASPLLQIAATIVA
jgi:hypothetical protein